MELLETRYPGFPGLNLSREVLDAQAVRSRDGTAPPPLLETQVVDAADSIAYDTHDADDAVELGLVTLDELLDLPLVADAAARVGDRTGPLAGIELRRAVLHELVDFQVADLVSQSLAALRSHGIDSVERVREAFRGDLGKGEKGLRIVAPSAAVAAGKRQLERFLFTRVYRSEKVMEVRSAAQEKLTRLFRWYCEHPDDMPPGFRGRAATLGVPRTAADYIAGMTDRYLELDFQRRLGGP